MVSNVTALLARTTVSTQLNGTINSTFLVPTYISQEEFLALQMSNGTNVTSNDSMHEVVLETWYPSGYSPIHIILASVVVTVLMVMVVVGNMLVIIAIMTEKALKNIQNWFIASLAVSDFFLGLIIMPFSLANELMGYWIFGFWWCEIHSAMDVLLCTASIMNLCLISLDRYWSITQAVDYLKTRTPARAAVMIAAVWLMSALVCIPPLLGWRVTRPMEQFPQCKVEMEPDKKLYFREQEQSDKEDREIDGRNIVRSWPKLNVVRRINFEDSEEDANKNQKKKNRTPPKKGNDRIRFLQNLKQEIENAKYGTSKVTESRYGTRSSVKKRSQQSKRLSSLAPTATEIPKLDDEDIIKNSAERKKTTEKGSLDSMNIQGEVDFKHVTNIQQTLKQNQILQINTRDHKTPAKLYIQTENIERPVTRSMTKKSPKNDHTSQLLTSEDIQLDRIESEVQETDPVIKAVSPHEQLCLETDNLPNVTDKIIQESMTCEFLQDKILHKMPQNPNDEVSLTVSPFNIDMQEELDNQPVLQDQEFTDYIHEEFQRMEIASEVQTQHQIVSEQEDGYCSSNSDSIQQNYTKVVEAVIHAHKPIEPCVEDNIEISQQHHLVISEASMSKTSTNALDNDAQSTQPISSLLLTDLQEEKVVLLRHSSYLDYLGILPISDATSQLTYSQKTTVIPHAVATGSTDDFDIKQIQTITPLVNSPEREVTMLNHIATEDVEKVCNIGDAISQGLHEKITEPKLPTVEILNTNLEPIQQLSGSISEKQRTGKVMKKKDFFNKENKPLSKFPYEKQVTITDSQVIYSASQTAPSLSSINTIIPTEDSTQEEDNTNFSGRKKIKRQRKQNKVLRTLQKVNLNDIISVKQSQTIKRKLISDLDRTEVFEELNSNNTKKSKQAQTKLKCEGTEQTRYKKQPQKIKAEKLKKVQKKNEKNTETELKHGRMVTRNRKKQKDANKFQKIKNKELRIVLTPTIPETCGSEMYSDKQITINNQQSNLNAIDVLEESINSDNQEEIQINADTDTYVLRKIDGKKKYIDFLSDNEDFEWSSSSWEGSSESGTENEMNGNKKTKKKIKKQKQILDDCENTQVSDIGILDLSTKKKRRNKRVDRQSSKEKGEEYITREGNSVPRKFIKENPCNRDNCFNACFMISEERRRNLFRHYWSQSSARKRDWLIGNSDKTDVKRQRTQGFSRRTGTYRYFINEGEGKRQVCLKFLLKTLDIRQKFVYNTISSSHFGSSKDDLRGRHIPFNKTPVELTVALKLYLTNLPVLPSHYCRKKTTKLYLPEGFRNLSNMYRMYKETQCSEGRTAVSEKVFREVFKRDFNYGFHVPRKDKCVQCLKFENDKSSEMQEIQKCHIKDKEETYSRFKAHQNIYLKDKSILCVSFDLQKVLNTPFGKSILLFYYRKLSVYNFTFYECGTKEGHCYTWNEIEGKRGANEISSILKLYIQKIDDMGTIRHLLFYSDCCPGQNRNKIVISCVQNCLKQCKNLDTIQLNYLLPGHTYMPVDSMHSVIEKSVKNTTVWTPSQWAMVFNLARKNPKPYHVNVMTHKDFMDWDSLVSKDYQKVLSGKIGKLRTVTFKRSAPHTLFVKYSMHPEAKTEIINLPKLKQTEPKRAYKSKLTISKKKQEDFNKMCSMNIIPEIYHKEYLNLHYTNTVEDVLEDTDIEDLPEE